MYLDLLFLFLGFYSTGLLVYLLSWSMSQPEKYGMMRYMLPVLIFVVLAVFRSF